MLITCPRCPRAVPVGNRSHDLSVAIQCSTDSIMHRATTLQYYVIAKRKKILNFLRRAYLSIPSQCRISGLKFQKFPKGYTPGSFGDPAGMCNPAPSCIYRLSRSRCPDAVTSVSSRVYAHTCIHDVIGDPG